MSEASQQSKGRCNHTWTAEEDKVLIECLSEIGSCWRGDNGFKPGYSLVVEKLMHERIPGCSIRSIPHIASRVKLLKKQWNAIHEMVGPNGGSGFGWNDAKKMIDVEKEIFELWVKSHPQAKGLYNKPFPHYDVLGTIFGKDVASGGNVECPQESVNYMNRDHATMDDTGTAFDEYLELTGDYIPAPCQDTVMPDITTEIPNESASVTAANVRKGKKRHRSPDPVIVEVVGVMKGISQNFQKTTDSMDKLVACYERKAAGSDRRMCIMGELEKFPELTLSQRLNVARQLGKDSNLTDIFISCNDDARRQLVSDLLFESM